MPIKLKPSTTARDRKTGKVKVEHHYIKSQSVETLINLLNTTTINKIFKITFKILFILFILTY